MRSCAQVQADGSVKPPRSARPRRCPASFTRFLQKRTGSETPAPEPVWEWLTHAGTAASDALPASIRRSAARHDDALACPNVSLCEGVHNAGTLLTFPVDRDHAEPLIEPEGRGVLHRVRLEIDMRRPALTKSQEHMPH